MPDFPREDLNNLWPGGYRFGFGRGLGFGFGRGRGRRWAVPYVCGWGAPYAVPYGAAATRQQEMDALQDQAKYFEEALAEINKGPAILKKTNVRDKVVCLKKPSEI